MTNEEALNKWEETRREYMHTFTSEILLAEGAEYFDKCIEALKKSIPEQLFLWGDSEWCGRIVCDAAFYINNIRRTYDKRRDNTSL